VKEDVTTRHNLSWDSLWTDSVWSWSAISTALFKVFYSYAGLDNMVNVLNEVKNPVRTLKTVSITALVTACAMYLLVNIAYLSVVPLDEIKQSGELIAALFFEKVFGPQLGRTVLPLAVALSAAGNVMVVSFALVGLRFAHSMRSSSADISIGPCEAGDCTPGNPSIWKLSLINAAFWFTSRWLPAALHPVFPCHRLAS
jgi:amino acid transporter